MTFLDPRTACSVVNHTIIHLPFWSQEATTSGRDWGAVAVSKKSQLLSLQSAKKVSFSVRTSNFDGNNKWTRLAGCCSYLFVCITVYCLKGG